MEYRDYEELHKKLCKKLEDIATSKNFDMGDIEAIDKITHSMKSLIIIMENEDGGSSQYGGSFGRGGMWNAEGSYRGNSYGGNGGGNNGGSYGGSNGGSYGGSRTGSSMNDSYAGNRGMHYVRGHYSRGDEVESEIRRMMEESNMSQSDKVTLERALDIIRR